MVKISDLLDLGHIALDLQATGVPDLLSRLCELLVHEDHLNPSCGENLCEALLNRERLGGTCLGEGIAVPHGYVVDLPHPILLLARLAEPIAYGEPPDGRPVDLVFLMTGPESSQREHVKVLARLMRLLHDRGWVEALRAAKTPEQALASVLDVESRHA